MYVHFTRLFTVLFINHFKNISVELVFINNKFYDVLYSGQYSGQRKIQCNSNE